MNCGAAVLVFSCALSLPAAADDLAAALGESRRLIQQEKFDQALQLLDAAKVNGQHDGRYLYLRGYLLYRLNRFGPAQVELRGAMAAGPPGLESRYLLARIAQSEGRYLDAVQWLEPCARAKPPLEDSAARISKLYWELGRTAQALNWTEKAVALAPWDGSLHYRLGRIFQQAGEEARAKSEFARSATSKTADGDGVRQLMECSTALAAHDQATAERIREQFLNGPALDPDLLVALGTNFATAGLPHHALQLYQTAVQRDPSSFPAQFNLGLALLNMKDPVGATAPLEASVGIAPESKGANAALALAYVMQDKYQQALAPLEAARQADAADVKTAGLLSVAYLRTGSAGKAVPILRQMLTVSKDDPKVYFLLVDCLNATENQQNALVVAVEATEHFPQLAKSWLSKGQQLARLGRYREAAPAFAKAVELEPGQGASLLGLADAEQKDGRYEAALDAYRRAAAAGADVSARLGVARCLVFLGRMPEARQVLEQSARLDASDSRVHSELSRVYARLGEKERAAEETRIAQRLRAQDGQGH